jgi:septal ring factor EnvC (AmiA/AmiB activator)
MPIYNLVSESRPAIWGLNGLGSDFAARQAIRDQYQAVAGSLRQLAPSLPANFQAVVNLYLSHVSSVIARGATSDDLKRIKTKLGEWEALLLAQMAAERAATERVAAEYAAEAAAERERLERVAAEREAAERAAAERAARERAAAADVSYQAPLAPGIAPPVASDCGCNRGDNFLAQEVISCRLR